MYKKKNKEIDLFETLQIILRGKFQIFTWKIASFWKVYSLDIVFLKHFQLMYSIVSLGCRFQPIFSWVLRESSLIIAIQTFGELSPSDSIRVRIVIKFDNQIFSLALSGSYPIFFEKRNHLRQFIAGKFFDGGSDRLLI